MTGKEILALAEVALMLEKNIADLVREVKEQIDKVTDVKRRKKIHKAFDKRDAEALRSAWFDM